MNKHEQHDKESLVDEMQRRNLYYTNAGDLSEEIVFRDILIGVLIRIAEALERSIQLRGYY